MTDFLTIATAAVNRGFSVIPLKPRGKDPLPGWGATSRSQNVGSFGQVPTDCNVGICADENFIILETDDEKRLRDLIRNMTGHELPITLMSAARHNRPHLFFKATAEALAAGNFQVPGLFECRFVNTYVVGAGSIHPTGAEYRWLNDYRPIELPAWLLTALQLLHGDERKANPVDVDVNGTRQYGEGERHYALTSLAGKLWDGEISEEELFRQLQDFNEKRCVPPKDYNHVLQIARYYVNKAEPNDPGPRVVLGGRVIEPFKFGPRGSLPRKSTHILEAKGEGFGEWFPRGEVSLICAPSGMGKTKLMLGLLEQLRKGESVFGHPEVTAEYRILTADRSLAALERSARKCHLDDGAIMHRSSRLKLHDSRTRAEILDDYLKQWEDEDAVPDVVFVDGMDMWVPKAAVSDFDVVTKFLEELTDLAEKWNVAVIGSVGSPKQKMKDRYVLTRDQVLGSIGWGRKVETICFMSLLDAEDGDSTRKAIWLPREGRSESYHFKFEKDGRFVETTIDTVSEPEGVAETREEKRDIEARMIQDIQAKQPGDRIGWPQNFDYLPKATAYNHLQNLAYHGWVGRDERGRWIVKAKKEQ